MKKDLPPAQHQRQQPHEDHAHHEIVDVHERYEKIRAHTISPTIADLTLFARHASELRIPFRTGHSILQRFTPEELRAAPDAVTSFVEALVTHDIVGFDEVMWLINSSRLQEVYRGIPLETILAHHENPLILSVLSYLHRGNPLFFTALMSRVLASQWRGFSTPIPVNEQSDRRIFVNILWEFASLEQRDRLIMANFLPQLSQHWYLGTKHLHHLLDKGRKKTESLPDSALEEITRYRYQLLQPALESGMQHRKHDFTFLWDFTTTDFASTERIETAMQKAKEVASDGKISTKNLIDTIAYPHIALHYPHLKHLPEIFTRMALTRFAYFDMAYDFIRENAVAIPPSLFTTERTKAENTFLDDLYKTAWYSYDTALPSFVQMLSRIKAGAETLEEQQRFALIELLSVLKKQDVKIITQEYASASDATIAEALLTLLPDVEEGIARRNAHHAAFDSKRASLRSFDDLQQHFAEGTLIKFVRENHVLSMLKNGVYAQSFRIFHSWSQDDQTPFGADFYATPTQEDFLQITSEVTAYGDIILVFDTTVAPPDMELEIYGGKRHGDRHMDVRTGLPGMQVISIVVRGDQEAKARLERQLQDEGIAVPVFYIEKNIV